MNLKAKAGPLPVWGWIVLAGGGLGLVVLVRKSKARKSTETESEPIPSSLASPFGPEAAGVGAGGIGGGSLPGEGKPIEPTPLTAVPGHEPTPVSSFLQTEHELQEGGWERTPAPTGSTAPLTVAAVQKAKAHGANPRAGVPFHSGNYRGMASHIYAHAVPGGVGPGHNIVVLGHVGGKTHAAKPNHGPHHVKPKHKAPAKHKPAKHHNAKRHRVKR